MARGTLRTIALLALTLGLLAILGRNNARVETPEPMVRTAEPEPATEAAAPIPPIASMPTVIPSAGFDVAGGEAGVTVTLAEVGGVTPRLTLSLDEVRVGGVLVATGGPTPRRDEGPGSFSYDRGTLVERYSVRPSEVEQDFVISELPARGDLVVTETLATNATIPAAAGPAPSLELPCGPVSFVISRAVAIDADGRRLPLDLEIADGRLRMTVPAAWVEAATLPIVVDPVVGGQILVANPQGTQLQDIAGGPNGWVATWFDGFNTSWWIYAAPISASGVVGAGNVVNTGANGASPAIAYSAALNKYLVVWIESSGSSSVWVAARFLDGNGALSGVKFYVGSYAANVVSVAVAADASGNFLALSQYGQQLDGAIVTSAGTVTVRPIIQTTGAQSPKVAFSNGEYLVAWNDWSTGSVRARGLSAAGALLTPVTTVPTGGSCNLAGIATGNNQFLVTWTEGATPTGMGRVVTANSAASLAFATAPITISSTACYDLAPVWSPPSSVWMITLRPQDNSLQAVTMSPAGVVSARTQIAAPQNHYIHAAGVTTANDALVLFVPDPTVSFPNPRILAQRYNIGTAAPPPAPANFAGVAQTTTSILWSWTDVAGETGYQVRDAAQGVKGSTAANVVSFTESTGLSENTAYNRHVNAMNGAAGGPDSNAVTRYTKVRDPLAGDYSVVSISATQINISLALPANANAGSTGCEIERSPDGSTGWTIIKPFATLGWAYNDTGRTPNTTYYYRVRYRNGDAVASAYSPVKSALTPLAAPTGLTATAGNGQVALSWTAVAGATSYNVKRATTSGGPYTVVGTPTTPSFTNTGLTNGVTYYFIVTAQNASGQGDNSAQVSATPNLPPPAATGFAGVAQTTTSILWSWTDVAGETGYQVRDAAQAIKGSTAANVVTFTESTGLSENTAYNRHVNAINGAVAGPDSNAVTRYTKVHDPVSGNLTLAAPSSTQINVTVAVPPNSAAGSTGCEIDRSPNGSSSWTTIKPFATAGYTFSDAGRTPATTYYYRVRYRNADGVVTANSPVKSLITRPPAPTGLMATAGDRQVTLNWAPTASATSYSVKRATVSGGPYTAVGSATSTTFTNTGLTNGTTYYYVVSALNAGGEGPVSAQLAATPVPALFTALLVVGNTTLGAGDAAIQARLQSLGYAVTVKLDSAAVTADATGKGLVLISSTVNSLSVGTKFRTVAVPVLTWEAALYNDMGLTGTFPGVDYGVMLSQTSVSIVTPGHPLAAGLTGTVAVVTAADDFAWGVPNSAAAKIATLSGDATKAVIFGYDKGKVMPGLTAPARRVGFFLDDTSASFWTTAGGNLFNAAVRWATASDGLPKVPATVVATPGNAQVALTWAASTGATSYNVKRATTSGGPYTTIASPTAASYTNTGLTNGTTYYYVVTAVNGSGETAPSTQVSATPNVPPPAPANFAGVAPSTTSIQWSWTDVAGETGYQVRDAAQASKGSTAVNVVTFTESTGLSENTAYNRHVNALNGAVASPNSNAVTRYTRVHTPLTGDLILTAASSTQVNVTVTAPPNSAVGSTGCEIDRSPDGTTGWTTIKAFTTAGYTFSDTGRTPATTYFYRVRYRNGDAITTAYSPVKSITTTGSVPAPPTGLAATAGNTQVTLSWTASAGATSYTVKRGTATGGPYGTTFTGITTTSFTNTGLVNGTTYYYVVTALNASGESGNSNQASATPVAPPPPPPAAPTGLAATAGNNQVSLSWTASAGATSYTVKRGTTSGGPYGTVFSGIVPTAFTDTGVTNRTTYYYVVTAQNASGQSGNSNQASATPVPPPPAAPTGLAATAGNAQATLSWTASAGATSYTVKRGTTNGGPYGTVFSGITTTSFTNTGLTNGTTYYYVVTAQNAGGQSGNSNQASATPGAPPPAAPTGLAATAGNAQVSLSWTASAGATSYTVKRGTANGGPYGTTFTGITTPSFTNTGLTNGTTYYYVVTALNASGESGNSNQASATPSAPTPLVPPSALILLDAQITLSWSPVPGATSYNVKRATQAGGPYSTLPSGAGIPDPFFSDLTGNPGTRYYYVVSAVDAGGQSGNSNEVTGIPAPAPTSLTAAPKDSAVDLSWIAVSGATHYLVQRSASAAGPFRNIGFPLGSSFTDSNAMNGTTYFYRVASFDGEDLHSRFAGPVTASASSAGDFPVLFVVGNASLSAATTPGDFAVSSQLQSMGYTVVVRSSSAALPTDANGKVLVLISSTSSATQVGSKFTGVSVPVLTWLGAHFNALGMVSPAAAQTGSSAGQTLLTMVGANASHPLAAGLSGSPQVVVNADTFTWGIPNSNAVPIATVFGGSQAAVFGYDAGATMPGPDGLGLAAPARRVGFFLTNTTASNLRAEGAALLAAAIRWAAGAPTGVATVTNILVDASDFTRIQWQAVEGATSYNVLRATAVGGPYTVIASGVSGTVYTDTTSGIDLTQPYFYMVQPISAGGLGILPQQGKKKIWSKVYIYGDKTILRTWTDRQKNAPADDPFGKPNPWNKASFQGKTTPSRFHNEDAGTDTWTFAAAGGGAAAGIDFSPSGATCTITVQKNAVAGTYRLTYSKRFTQKDDATKNETPETSVDLIVDKARALTVQLRFPYVEGDDNKRSGRAGIFAPDNPADSPPSKVRDAAREALGLEVQKALSIYFDGAPTPVTWTAPTKQAWEQANLGFYVTADKSFNEKVGGVYPDHVKKNQFPAAWIRDNKEFTLAGIDNDGNGTDTAEALKVQSEKNKTFAADDDTINVYYIPIIHFTGVAAGDINNGWTIEGAGKSKRTIFIGDVAGNKHMETVAHEIGHVLGLLHPEEHRDTAKALEKSSLNNPEWEFEHQDANLNPKPLAEWYNLMQTRPSRRLRTYLTDVQAKEVYEAAKDHSAKRDQEPQ